MYLASDLPDHDDALCFWVLGEPFEAIDEVSTIERVAPDTHTGALAHAWQLEKITVGQGG